jgi:hypothetical protein
MGTPDWELISLPMIPIGPSQFLIQNGLESALHMIQSSTLFQESGLASGKKDIPSYPG